MIRVALVLLLSACSTRAIPPRAIVWDDVAPVLERACVPCHGPERAEGAWRADAYLSAIGCPSGGATPAVEPPDERAAILAVLSRDDHAGRLTEEERALVTAWCEEGALAREGRAHAAGFVDPRSADFHGTVLRSERWARLLSAEGDGACARCHDTGAPRERDTAPGATACTGCHDGEGGPLACSTCHGEGARAFPPRSTCWYPLEASTGGAHEAHDRARVGCSTCHGERTLEQLAAGAHGDGTVDVVLDPARAGTDARFDVATRSCTVACHDRGGSEPTPRWRGGEELGCGACHASPPPSHDYPGGCDGCHDEAAPDGTALVPGPLHVNGVVDLGDGSGGCGACHGAGDDPSPSSGAHRAHAGTELRVAIDCAECHVVPDEPLAEGHLDATPGAEVTFGALASARGASPVFDADTCSEVACHGEGLSGAGLSGSHRTVGWGEGPIACDACHGVPPPAPHAQDLRCSASRCHGGYATSGPGISELGRTVHVDGRIDTWP